MLLEDVARKLFPESLYFSAKQQVPPEKEECGLIPRKYVEQLTK